MPPTSQPDSLDVVGAVFTRQPADTGETEVLAFRRAPSKPHAGEWEFPGGKVEPGETCAQALCREITEELGIDIIVGEEIITSETAVDDRLIRLSCFFVSATDEPRVSTDHDELRWLTLSNLNDVDWAEPDVPIVAELQNRQETHKRRG